MAWGPATSSTCSISEWVTAASLPFSEAGPGNRRQAAMMGRVAETHTRATRRSSSRDDKAATRLADPQDADAAHCCLAGSAPGPSPVAATRPVRETVSRWLHSRRLAPQTAGLPACAATAHRAHPLVFAALRLHRGSQRSPIPRVRPPTHPTGHWPSSWLNQAVPLAARPLPPLLCLFDTMPSSSSCFRTSLLVYHLLPVISKYLG